jgi:hypothetical protein
LVRIDCAGPVLTHHRGTVTVPMPAGVAIWIFNAHTSSRFFFENSASIIALRFLVDALVDLPGELGVGLNRKTL